MGCRTIFLAIATFVYCSAFRLPEIKVEQHINDDSLDLTNFLDIESLIIAQDHDLNHNRLLGDVLNLRHLEKRDAGFETTDTKSSENSEFDTSFDSSGDDEGGLDLIDPTAIVKLTESPIENKPTPVKSTTDSVHGSPDPEISTAPDRGPPRFTGRTLPPGFVSKFKPSVTAKVGGIDTPPPKGGNTNETEDDTGSPVTEPVGNTQDVKESSTAGVRITILVVTGVVLFVFVAIFVYRKYRTRKYGEYSEVSKGRSPHQNGTELQRFSQVDMDVKEMVTVPLNQGEGQEEEDNVTSTFKQDFNLSPVNIKSHEVVVDKSLLDEPLTLFYSSSAQEHAITNLGGRVKIVPGNGNSYISGGPLGNKQYNLDHVVIQWGRSDDRGSAHTLNGMPYAGEMHFVHWNSKDYSSFQEASSSPDGLAVLAAFISVTEEDSKQLGVVCESLSNVKFKTQSWRIPELVTSTLLPEDIGTYWTYPGSLLTPPQSPSVTWIIFSPPVSITKTQMQDFRNLNSHAKGDSSANNRGIEKQNIVKIQPLGTRIIRTVCRDS